MLKLKCEISSNLRWERIEGCTPMKAFFLCETLECSCQSEQTILENKGVNGSILVPPMMVDCHQSTDSLVCRSRFHTPVLSFHILFYLHCRLPWLHNYWQKMHINPVGKYFRSYSSDLREVPKKLWNLQCCIKLLRLMFWLVSCFGELMEGQKRFQVNKVLKPSFRESLARRPSFLISTIVCISKEASRE